MNSFDAQSPITVTIHPGQFPGRVRQELLTCLRERAANHKFHYDTVKQSQKWIAVHEAHSPPSTDPACGATYDRAFIETARLFDRADVQVIGLGCGAGEKDVRLLARLREGAGVDYLPSDVSTPLVLLATQAAAEVIPRARIRPLVCDLATADDLPALLDEWTPASSRRLIAFFGMVPNFEPPRVLTHVSPLVRRGDHLLLSANLAPGEDYEAGVRHVLPQYDNPLTREWLVTFLLDLGVDRADGEVSFSTEPCPFGTGLQRITARFLFERPRALRIDGEDFFFQKGESFRLFFSYRHTPASVRALLAGARLEVVEQWISASGEEGVFLATRA